MRAAPWSWRIAIPLALCCFFVATLSGRAQSTQADLSFDTTVHNPAYSANGPKVLFDEAHDNVHTSQGTYKPFVELITHDGFQVIANKQKFENVDWSNVAVLVISNPRGAPKEAPMAMKARPAFTPAECAAVRQWVSNGGSLLLIADHYPIGSAAAPLAAAFGVVMENGFTGDPLLFDRKALDVSWIIYRRDNKSLGDHPITRGRTASDRVNVVEAFTGQSLRAPQGAVSLLRLSREAYNVNKPGNDITSAAKRSQGVALEFGRGRVVVLGEAAMLSAQGSSDNPFGMNYPGIDNRQFALNVMRWLSRALN